MAHVDIIEDANGVQSQIKHSYENKSGNIEINSTGTNTKGDPKKVNIVSAGDIQFKPGNDSTIQLDVENDTTNPNEVCVKFCNGSYSKSKRVVRSKINVAEIILDNQNANTDNYSTEEIHIKLRHDKATEPVYGKMHARAWDIRCHGHGGIALQPAGHDGSNHENKIKFESDRTSPLGAETTTYNGEGGKGLEFATFNNEHSSIFTGTYRFNKDGILYAVKRGDPVTVGEKTDYPTQADDFKDILPTNSHVTFEDLVNAVRYLKTQSGFTSWIEANPLIFPAE